MLLIYTLLPEPLYTVCMACLAVFILLAFCLFSYRMMIKVLGDDFMTTGEDETIDNEDISHLHRVYSVEENGEKFTIRTNSEGYVKSIAGNGKFLEPTMPVRLVQEGLTCLLTVKDGKVIREFELAENTNHD